MGGENLVRPDDSLRPTLVRRESEGGGDTDGERAEVLAKAVNVKHEREQQSSEPIGREFSAHTRFMATPYRAAWSIASLASFICSFSMSSVRCQFSVITVCQS